MLSLFAFDRICRMSLPFTCHYRMSLCRGNFANERNLSDVSQVNLTFLGRCTTKLLRTSYVRTVGTQLPTTRNNNQNSICSPMPSTAHQNIRFLPHCILGLHNGERTQTEKGGDINILVTVLSIYVAERILLFFGCAFPNIYHCTLLYECRIRLPRRHLEARKRLRYVCPMAVRTNCLCHLNWPRKDAFTLWSWIQLDQYKITL